MADIKQGTEHYSEAAHEDADRMIGLLNERLGLDDEKDTWRAIMALAFESGPEIVGLVAMDKYEAAHCLNTIRRNVTLLWLESVKKHPELREQAIEQYRHAFSLYLGEIERKDA